MNNRWLRRCRRWLPVAAVALMLAPIGLAPACGHWGRPRLQGGRPSPEALAQSVLNALAARDLETLKSLALSPEEFHRYVWPELPVSNPKTNVTWEFVWEDVHSRSIPRLAYLYDRYKGKRLSLVKLKLRRKIETYKSHRAYPDWLVELQDEEGKKFDYPIFGTLIEMDGVYKVYCYAPYD